MDSFVITEEVIKVMNESTILGINFVVNLSIYCSGVLLEFNSNGCNWLVGHVAVWIGSYQ